jgi:hypothetical protein
MQARPYIRKRELEMGKIAVSMYLSLDRWIEALTTA